MFNFLKKKKKLVIGSPAKGEAVSLDQVSDPTFSQEILGKGAAVIPAEGEIYAPADGTVGMVFETLHAVSMTTENGAEILIHVGLDTVKLKGEGFTGHVKAGEKVRKGDLLLSVDLERIRKAGYDTIIPVVICNTDQFASVVPAGGGNVAAGAGFIEIEEK